MFATLAGGYPFGPLPGTSDPFAEARHRRASGASSAAAFAEAADRYVTEIVAEQAAAGLAMVHDAWARWPDAADGGLAAALRDGSADPAALVAAWRWADDGIDAVVKQVLPGPWSAARALAGDDPRGAAAEEDRQIALLAASIRALGAAGCPVVQVDEPAVARLGPDPAAWRSVESTLGRLRDAVPAGTHLSLALPGGAPDPAGHATLAGLRFASYLVDVTAGPDAWQLIDALPAAQGVIVGAADAAKVGVDDPEMLVWAATYAAEAAERGHIRVGIATSGSIAHLPRLSARRKIESIGTAVRLAKMGPLGEVARALQADPGTCRIASLRRLAADRAAAASPG